jgi:hypothetical protein
MKKALLLGVLALFVASWAVAPAFAECAGKVHKTRTADSSGSGKTTTDQG